MVYFIDVGQGDCTALKIPHSKSVVLIDTGGSKYKDVANKDIIPFLKRNVIYLYHKPFSALCQDNFGTSFEAFTSDYCSYLTLYRTFPLLGLRKCRFRE